MQDVKVLATAEGTEGHGLTRISADKSERLAADRTGGNAASPVTRTGGSESSETADVGRVLPCLDTPDEQS